MASKRDRVREARRHIFSNLLVELDDYDLGALSPPHWLEALDQLRVEFRRRSDKPDSAAPPPDHDPIPGIGLFQALPPEKATPYDPT